MNAGGGEVVDASGLTWVADVLSNSPGIFSFTNATEIQGTESDALFQSERYSTLQQFQYDIPVPSPSIYEVTLGFAEIYNGAQAIGKRIFDVSVEGDVVFSDLDIYSEVGGYTALSKAATTTVTDGFLTISFTAKVQNPKLSSIEIRSIEVPSPTPTVPPPTATPPTNSPPTAACHRHQFRLFLLTYRRHQFRLFLLHPPPTPIPAVPTDPPPTPVPAPQPTPEMCVELDFSTLNKGRVCG